MFKHLITIILFFIGIAKVSAQTGNSKTVYIVDSIIVVDDPEEGDDLIQDDIEDVIVLKDKDSLKKAGFEQFDGAIYVFTKKYRSRPQSIKLIPSTKQLEFRNGIWHWRGNPYNGKFIDYYYSGDKKEEGTFVDGKYDGVDKIYFKNGSVLVEREYKNGYANGMEKEYYSDSSLKQSGKFIDDKEDGLWQMFFPNGRIKQADTFSMGNRIGKTTVYYSTGKILAIETTQNGQTIPDERYAKTGKLLKLAKSKIKEKDYEQVIRLCSKAIDIDSGYAEAYFIRGATEYELFSYDDAIADFDQALIIEPFMDRALVDRAVARIEKNEMGNNRTVLKKEGVMVLAGKDTDLPKDIKDKVCTYLQKAFLMGNETKKAKEIAAKYCNLQ
jgi:antitoxin component YwqK of YwqJK toxin-antitoxin module